MICIQPGVAIEPDAGSLTGTSIYATKAKNPASTMPTHARVIEHLEQTVGFVCHAARPACKHLVKLCTFGLQAPVDWKTMKQVSYLNPKQPALGGAKPLMEYMDVSNLGPRARMVRGFKVPLWKLPSAIHAISCCQLAHPACLGASPEMHVV